MFDLVIFDETSQFDFIEALPVLYRARSAAVVGDPEQIEPVIDNLSWAKQKEMLRAHGLAELIEPRLLLQNERAFKGCIYNSMYLFAARVPHAERVMLTSSYRSCRQVTNFISRLSYQGLLESKRPGLPPIPVHPDYHHGFVWVDVVDQVQRRGRTSRVSEAEADAVIVQLRKIAVELQFAGSIGIISPYGSQAEMIKQKIRYNHELAPLLQPDLPEELTDDGDVAERPDDERLFVSTVHKAQGSERDVIILSLCASGSMSNRFIENRKIINVAVSRARSMVVVVCCQKAVLRSRESPFYLDADALSGIDMAAFDRQLDADGRRAEDKFESPYERELYYKMRELGLNPIPQHRIITYNRRLDFALMDEERKCFLDIEVDGSNHLDYLGMRKRDDYVRDAQMRSLNYQIIRFWTREVGEDSMLCAQKVKNKWQEMLKGNL